MIYYAYKILYISILLICIEHTLHTHGLIDPLQKDNKVLQGFARHFRLRGEASPAFFVFRRGTDGGQLVMSWTGASVEKFETNAGALSQA